MLQLSTVTVLPDEFRSMHVYKLLILVQLMLIESVSLLDAYEMENKGLVPIERANEFHHLSERQSQSTCQFFFYLNQPPSSLQCLPQVNQTLNLTCKFLLGQFSTRVVPLTIAWFFSQDGVVGECVTFFQFAATSLAAFESILVVRI